LSKTQTDLLQDKATLTANLQEQLLEYESKLQKKTNTIGWMTIGFLAFVVLAVLLGCRQHYKSKGNVVQQQTQPIPTYEKEEAVYQKEIAELSEKIYVLEQTRVVRELKYKVKKGDVLHELGELFYNDSDAGIQIALDNKIYDIRGLPIGKTLTIKYRAND